MVFFGSQCTSRYNKATMLVLEHTLFVSTDEKIRYLFFMVRLSFLRIIFLNILFTFYSYSKTKGSIFISRSMFPVSSSLIMTFYTVA
jgi:hypothetical protein